MEKKEQDTLLKIRSSRACISDGYQLYTSNFRRVFRHTWPVAVAFALLSAIASAMPVIISPTLLLPGLLLGTLAVVGLLIAANRQLHRRGFMQPTGRIAFPAWLRHIGTVLLVGLVCLFTVAILSLFTALPTTIMMAANWESQIGVLSGDPVGMPRYVTWLSVGAFLIAGFLQAYVWLSVLCPFYLMRASIALQEQERQKFNAR